ncbi:MAG: hypothetical protein LBB11_01365 [Puniceicoccales bacterium]|jgi:uncharacterized protein YjeT (DUF2065 family)|nr:hypothetical protein [Puniceicoccales bacterium]
MSLKLAAFSVGTVLVLCGSFFAFRTRYCESFLRKFLRSSLANTAIFSLAGIWFLGHVLTLGESDFGQYKYLFFVFFSTMMLIALVKIRDFLCVRGTAILALLTANELLQAIFMDPHQSRLILVIFAYIVIIAGMLFGGWPYKGRDFVDFLFFHPARSRRFGLLTMCYGVLTLTTLFW